MTLTPRYPVFLHGGDYNPDQWLDRPDILEKDIELMHEAHVNCVSVGIFSWARLEPEEGVYDFAWLDEVIDRLWKGGIHVCLATPSGARPAWMAQKYPEVLRVDENLHRPRFGERHNHCLTSPVYREKVRQMNTRLAQHYHDHPAVILWHLSNEYSGDCRCPLCQDAWRAWLKEKYGDLESLNSRWWTSFWSQRYTDWSQVEAPGPMGEKSNTSMWVDWRRFCTHQCRTFIRNEKEAVQAVDPTLKTTANLMYRFWDYDYFSLAEEIDVVSWDAYPGWHSGDDTHTGADFAMQHDLMRSLKKQPFLLMESTPSKVNWKPVNKLKRPGMHLLSSLQAVAHGSQSVMYFQWRKGRGAAEMFHGAVVDHDGRSDVRVFQDVRQVGLALEKLAPVYDSPREDAQVCIIFDWNNWWAIDYAQTGHNKKMKYNETVLMHYRQMWERGIAVDFQDMRGVTDLSGYKLVICPMLFMFREGFEQKLRTFVEQGGTLVMTYDSGVVDGDDLAFLGGRPGGLMDVLGMRGAELDALFPDDRQAMVMNNGRRFPVTELCEIPEHLGAEVLATYGHDFYAGMPCLTRNRFGKGTAYYLAAKVNADGLDAMYQEVLNHLSLDRALDAALPRGVTASRRGDTVFLQNYNPQPVRMRLTKDYTDLLTGSVQPRKLILPGFGVMVLTEMTKDQEE
ncbi:MAG: beta-galactosidase [Clostridiales bacterium]|nr:beta-galactosidase [Clostridiales bacterium]